MYFIYVSSEWSPIYNGLEEKNGIQLLQNNIAAIMLEYPDVSFLLAEDLNVWTKYLLDFKFRQIVCMMSLETY